MSHLPGLSVWLAVAREEGVRASLIIGAVIGGIVLAGVLLFLLARRLRRRMHEETPTAGDVLSGFRNLHYKGELSREEFQRIRSSLAQQIRRDVTDKKADE